jgi:hypothetical protein
MSFMVIDTGKSANSFDNYHQSYKGVTAPKGFPAQPGCPECIHIHWRWGRSIGGLLANGDYFPDLNGGNPLIPEGSDQSVSIAVVAYHANEEQPRNYLDLLTGENLRSGKDLVFWYSATGHQNRDTFFRHGGFFGTH